MRTLVTCKYGSEQTAESKLAFQVCHYKIRHGAKQQQKKLRLVQWWWCRVSSKSLLFLVAPSHFGFTHSGVALLSSLPHGRGVTGWSLHCSLSRVVKSWRCKKELLHHRVSRLVSPLRLTCAGAAGSVSITVECVSHFTLVERFVHWTCNSCQSMCDTITHYKTCSRR